MDDTGTYSCEIMEFVKNGEKDQTDCWLQVEGIKPQYIIKRKLYLKKTKMMEGQNLSVVLIVIRF